MGFSGRLEDLRLRELLRVLGLSGSSGWLQLHCGSLRAGLLFDEGAVVSVWRQPARQTPLSGEGHAGLFLGEKTGQAARHSKRGTVLALVQELLFWEKGDFSFMPGSAETIAEPFCGEEILRLDRGMSVQDLLGQEGIRLPETRNVKDPETETSEVQEALNPIRPDEAFPQVLLVDDDLRMAEQLVQALAQQGVQACSLNSGRDLLDAVRSSWAANRQPLLLIDLIMPRLHGGGILGGLELLEEIHSSIGEPKCLVYSDYPCPEVERLLRRFGAVELFVKPAQTAGPEKRKSSAETEFCTLLAVRAATLLKEAAQTAPARFPGQETIALPVTESASRPSIAVQTVGIGTLNSMFQELRAAEDGDQVMLLVLRFATEILSRAVLFSVGKERLVGVGQFGYGSVGGTADDKIRRLTLPLTEESLVQGVVVGGTARIAPLGQGHWDKFLGRELDFNRSEEIFVGPLVRNGQVVAVLCGDQQRARCETEDSQMLELFLQQAGMALDKLIMAEQLNNIATLLGKTFAC